MDKKQLTPGMHLQVKVLVILCLLLLITLPVLAQSGGDYSLTWSKVVSGGEILVSGGDYSLSGAAGQPEAGAMAGGDYYMGGGFWPGSEVPEVSHAIYLPLIVR